MTHAMKIRKGDTVHILAGKDRGKEGRVLDARPRDGKVLVENLNLVIKHTRPRPLANASRMGGQQMSEGGRILEARAAAGLARHARLPDVQAADARRGRTPRGAERRHSEDPRVQARRLRTGHRSLMADNGSNGSTATATCRASRSSTRVSSARA